MCGILRWGTRVVPSNVWSTSVVRSRSVEPHAHVCGTVRWSTHVWYLLMEHTCLVPSDGPLYSDRHALSPFPAHLPSPALRWALIGVCPLTMTCPTMCPRPLICVCPLTVPCPHAVLPSHGPLLHSTRYCSLPHTHLPSHALAYDMTSHTPLIYSTNLCYYTPSTSCFLIFVPTHVMRKTTGGGASGETRGGGPSAA